MSYATSSALQVAIFQRLTEDAALDALVGSNIFDAVPSGTLPATYVTLGAEDASDRSDGSHGGTWYRFVISVVTQSAGFQAAKDVAGAVNDALVDADLTLVRGTLAGLYFYRARARRVGNGQTRRIDLTFRARVDDSA